MSTEKYGCFFPSTRKQDKRDNTNQTNFKKREAARDLQISNLFKLSKNLTPAQLLVFSLLVSNVVAMSVSAQQVPELHGNISNHTGNDTNVTFSGNSTHHIDVPKFAHNKLPSASNTLPHSKNPLDMQENTRTSTKISKKCERAIKRVKNKVGDYTKTNRYDTKRSRVLKEGGKSGEMYFEREALKSPEQMKYDKKLGKEVKISIAKTFNPVWKKVKGMKGIYGMDEDYDQAFLAYKMRGNAGASQLTGKPLQLYKLMMSIDITSKAVCASHYKAGVCGQLAAVTLKELGGSCKQAAIIGWVNAEISQLKHVFVVVVPDNVESSIFSQLGPNIRNWENVLEAYGLSPEDIKVVDPWWTEKDESQTLQEILNRPEMNAIYLAEYTEATVTHVSEIIRPSSKEIPKELKKVYDDLDKLKCRV